ncbi:MAG: hypothetical protein HKN48_14120 [Flavobacteriaceae bacterium]|nr:hypothetical protein [Flavobacteriaceae bacterium]
MKKNLFLLLFILPISIFSQNFEDSWSGFFSYTSIKGISQGNDKVYVAAENAIFTLDLFTQEVSTLSSIQGLSGEIISSLYYSEIYGLLIVGHENGLIEIIRDGEEDILSVVDILEKTTIPPDTKNINDFYEYEGNLYISTEFGISVYDLERLEFGDTYFIGDFGAQININQVAVLPPYIYAATSMEGVKRAMVEDDNLIDFENWSTITSGNIRGIETLGNEIYIARNNNTIARYLEGVGFAQVGTVPSSVLDFKTINDQLSITTIDEISVFGPGYTPLASVSSLPEFDYELQSGIAFGNNMYLGTAENGLLIVPYGSFSATQILPDGPILNRPFSIDATPGQLWVVFGDISVNFNPFNPLSRLGISNLRDSTWTNIPYSEITGATDIVNVTINRENPNEVYMSSYIGGLLEINDQTPVELFNQNNSPLEIPFNDPDVGIRIFGSDFDRQGNLWFVQSKLNNGLIRKSPSNQFTKIDFSDVLNGENELALTELKISREGYVFFGTAENGLVGYNPNNGILNRIDEGSGNGNLSNRNVRALEFDNQNRLWIGTISGLRVIFNVGGFFEDLNNVESQSIIILDDGIPQELLFEQSITDIEVDGSNNKWVATATSGVFYLSPNGQETLLRFTKDNSPLPSNNVQDIAIDELNGRVYFATINGLVAFDGTSTAPRDNLENVYAFPNPVRPGFTGNVTID